MPMVAESSPSTVRTYKCSQGSGVVDFALKNGRDRSQTGFRTRALNALERQTLNATAPTWANSLSVIGVHEDLSREGSLSPGHQNHASRAWPVNDRDYTETRYGPTGFTLSYLNSSDRGVHWTPINVQGALGPSGTLASVMPALPTTSALQNLAGGMLRNSRPPKAGFNLARFAAEQREAPLLFKMANYMPRSKKEMGGAVLNYLFGVKPTGSDLGYLAELVLRSDSGLQRMLNAEKIREKKYGTSVLFKDDGFEQLELTLSSSTTGGGTFTAGKHTMRYIFLARWTDQNYGNVLYPNFLVSYSRKQILRTFATWEYYVPQPMEIRGRLASYRKKAALLLSSAKLEPSVVYELTPWSWLADWFVDFGGLLRYQQDVIDNQIVATNCGYSTWEEYTARCNLSHYRNITNDGVLYNRAKDVKFTPVGTMIRWRRHKRRSGNPYSIGPTWSLTNQQWAILGALGLSRGIDLPIKR